MKHIHKYIFATILALLLTSTVQSAPKAFDSLGNELEALQKDCKQYLKDPKISKKLKATCKKFNAKVDKAFKMGYPLDASVESDTADEKKTSRYLALLRKADESGESLRELKRSREKKKSEEKKAKREKERKALLDKKIDKYKKSCDSGDTKKCYEVGLILDTEKSYEDAVRFYSKACDGEDSRGCNSLGEMYYSGRVINKNLAKAAILFSKACDANYASGCVNLGGIYEEKQGAGQEKEQSEMHGFQRKVVIDYYREAVKLYKKTCDAGFAEGCYRLGDMFGHGRGVKRNIREAVRLYRKACDGGSAEGCTRLRSKLYREIDAKQLLARIYRKGCDMGNAKDCSDVGGSLLYGIRGEEKNFYESARFLRKACNLDNSFGCWALGYDYELGRGVPQNLYMAAKLYKKSCYSNRGTPAKCDDYRRLKNRGY